MINYFENFPKITYPDGNGKIYSTVDMTVRFKIIEKVIQNPNAYYEYYWQDSDRLDIVAQKYYGDSRLSWVIMLSSQIYDWIYDLPLSNEKFDEYLEKKYEVDNSYDLKNIVHHYEDITGTVIDKNAYNLLGDSYKKHIDVYSYELYQNELKRNIKLLSKDLINKILSEFDYRLQTIKNNRKLSNYDER